jgi:hypothetical protein
MSNHVQSPSFIWGTGENLYFRLAYYPNNKYITRVFPGKDTITGPQEQ